MYILVLWFPLLSFLCLAFCGRILGREICLRLSCLLIFVAFLISLFIFFEVGLTNIITTIKISDWFIIGVFNIKFGLLFDSLTAIMLIIILCISFFVHLYSIDYMSHDPHITRFMCYLSLFTFFMLILVTSDNFLQLFLGWEGVGLASYLLINFWFTRVLANKAALKAMMMNRIADVFFIFAIVLMLLHFGTTDYVIIFNLFFPVDFIICNFFLFKINLVTLICIFLFIGGIGKSAQLGLHTWLPDAMEGPTPVSSLLHAATMVTAGVFLILRSSPIFEYSSFILVFLCLLGGITAFFTAIIGIFQYDVKKIIAYSTCSQLGYMFLSLGLSNYYIAIFHLFNHAFFKALLFLSAGAIIHAVYDEQDMRKMGCLVNFLPFTYFCVFLGSITIMGFPFLTGFYSKDLLLELIFARFLIDSYFIYFLATGAAFFTSIYSIRLLLFVFFIETNLYRKFFISYEASNYMFYSMVSLSLASVFVGYLFSDIFLGWGTYFWSTSIFILPKNFSYIDCDFLPPIVKNLPLILSFVGLLLSLFLYTCFLKKSQFKDFEYFFLGLYKKVSVFFFFAGFFNFIYNKIFIWLLINSYEYFTKYLDKGFFENFGPFGFYKIFHMLSYHSFKLAPSIIFFAICLMFLFITFILFWILLASGFFHFYLNNSSLFFLSLLILFFESKIK